MPILEHVFVNPHALLRLRRRSNASGFRFVTSDGESPCIAASFDRSTPWGLTEQIRTLNPHSTLRFLYRGTLWGFGIEGHKETRHTRNAVLRSPKPNRNAACLRAQETPCFALLSRYPETSVHTTPLTHTNQPREPKSSLDKLLRP